MNTDTILLTTSQAAERLGVTVRAVQKIISEKKIQAQKFGRDYFIAPSEIEKYIADRPKAGWPRGKPRKLN